ncbi:MAG TPA: PEP-CTERM sorting domain-containing protein [Bryobacteraceae bacterium]|nr:PEP-CTERM sorting domain-containing protein [Bryobacteraceae bacterium]
MRSVFEPRCPPTKRPLYAGKYFIWLTFIVLCAFPVTLLGDTITLGVNNGGNADPFAGPFPGQAGTEYQEAYASSDFSGTIAISSIDFFLLPGSQGSTLYGGTYQVSLSVITANINSLSQTDLASNIGADNTIFSTEILSGAAPNVLAFSGGPFLYDPSAGNLLLNIQVSNPTGGGNALFEDGEGDGPAGIVRYSNFYGGTTGYGLVTQFTGSSSITNLSTLDTPEPRTLMLFACGLAGLFIRRRQRV